MDPNTLRVGNRIAIYNSRGLLMRRAVVRQVTENHIALNWALTAFSTRNDILLKKSPLWQFLELIE